MRFLDLSERIFRSVFFLLLLLLFFSNNLYAQQSQHTLNPSTDHSYKVWLWIALIIAFDLIIFIIFIIRKRKEKRSLPTALHQANEKAEKNIKKNIELVVSPKLIETPYKIYLLGGFQFLQDHADLSSKFSPLLKELFLKILFQSINTAQGASTLSLIENFWPDMPEKNARNNLAVNIGKLRNILGPDLQDSLVNQSGHWKFEITQNSSIIFCDYLTCLEILNKPTELDETELNFVIRLCEKGSILPLTNYEWLDNYKANISNLVIDKLMSFVAHYKSELHMDFVIKIADTILTFDSINENAIAIKCKALINLGKHSLANDAYTKFTREYKMLYDTDYPKSIKSIIG